jgi:hypothetical protein
MNIVTLNPWLSNDTLTHNMTNKSQNLKMCCCDQHNETKWQQHVGLPIVNRECLQLKMIQIKH